MLGIPFGAVAAYLGFASLLFYVQKHATNFRGGSANFGLALQVVALIGTVAQFVFYGLVWYHYGFLPMLALIGLSIASGIVLVIVEAVLRIPFYALSLLGVLFALPLGALAFWLLLN